MEQCFFKKILGSGGERGKNNVKIFLQNVKNYLTIKKIYVKMYLTKYKIFVNLFLIVNKSAPVRRIRKSEVKKANAFYP
jgi:hypothetical protein